MPSVIDTLIVRLGIDPSQFSKGQAAALASFKKTSDEAKQRAKDMEENARRAANGFAKVRNETIGFLAAVAGASGIKQFVANLVTGDAAAARLGRTTGIATDELTKWGTAGKLAGGSAEAVVASMAALWEQVQNFRAGKGGPIAVIYGNMLAEGGKLIDLNKDINEQLLAIAHNAQIIEAKTPGRGNMYLRDLGIGPDLANVLIRGDQFTQQMLDRAAKLGAATKQNAKDAEGLLGKWREIGQAIEGIVRPLESLAGPILDDLIKKLEKIQGNQAEQASRDAGAGQNKFNGWMNYIAEKLGIGRLGPEGLVSYGQQGATDAAPVSGGIFGGLGYKPMDWDTIGKPLSGLPPTGAAAALSRGGGPTTSEVHIGQIGPITVTTNATSAEGVASGLAAELAKVAQRRRLAMLANTGGI